MGAHQTPEKWHVPAAMRHKMVGVARNLRRTQTPTEKTLWHCLRRKQRGYKVRRQQPIGSFVVDFYVPQSRLVIEIDGPVHALQRDRDRERQALLEELDLVFLRFSTSEVEERLSETLLKIDQYVRDLSKL
ncbi:endonuclease domain-containing protein [Almyronema epifaneia]|uniref:Endonuclease domain-containing protein n=1 Tax=Almyronema epifaneia S1 TaxID=2991925 RepID=A0ABW6IK31_9CYAN